MTLGKLISIALVYGPQIHRLESEYGATVVKIVDAAWPTIAGIAGALANTPDVAKSADDHISQVDHILVGMGADAMSPDETAAARQRWVDHASASTN